MQSPIDKVSNSESGAALATTMVFLVVLSVVGISSMQNNRLEQKMTTNLQQLNHSFQYAESGLVRGLKAPDRLDTGDTGDIYPGDYDAPDMWMCYDSDDPAIAADCIDSSSNGNAAVITRYRGRGNLPPQNYSLESGFATHYFFVGSEGTANQSISTHNVGISLVGPSGVQ